MNKLLKKVLLISFTLITFMAFGLKVSAAKAKVNYEHIWSEKLGLDRVQYYVKKGSSSLSRYTTSTNSFIATNSSINNNSDPFGGNKVGARWFCVQPGAPIKNGGVDGEITSNPPSTKYWYYDVGDDAQYLQKVFSCWREGDYYSIAATQIIAWELVTEERGHILYNKILASTPDYTPYLNDDTNIFGNQSSKTTNYQLLSNTGSGRGKLKNTTARQKLFSAYKEVLECAARFYKNPTSSFVSDTTSVKNPIKLSSYNATTETFSGTVNDNLLNYYEFVQVKGNSNVKVSLSGSKLSITATKEISASSPAIIELHYAYIDSSKKTGLRNDGEMRYLINETKYDKTDDYSPQAMARGSESKTVFISVYTGEKPTYQMKIKKQDDAGNPISGVKFYVCAAKDLASGKSCTSSNNVGTMTTDSTGGATLTGIKHIGQYIVTEAEAPSGHVIDKTSANVTVLEANKTGSSSYATADKTFVNKRMHLKMTKRTLDENGNVIDLPGDACANLTCPNENNRENGPIFTITKDGKKVCVKETSIGKYEFDSLSSECTNGTLEKVKTCNGAFDIVGIPEGTYIVTEVATACGTTLPSNPTQTVVVKPNTEVTNVTMLNGVTGLVFTKVTENGTLLDGGKFTLQKKENGVYKDILLIHKSGAIYTYQNGVTTESENATYLLETKGGIINVTNLPTGEYRMVEKQAPSGYDLIKEKDSTATVTISDKSTDNKTDYYQIKLVNQKTATEGSSDDAEFVVTIKTGRNVINYPLVFGILAALLVVGLIIRKKTKK